MEERTLERCVSLMNSDDQEAVELGKQLFLASDPTFGDVFILHCRLKTYPEEYGDTVSVFHYVEYYQKRRKAEALIENIRSRIWGNYTHGT